MAADSTIAAKVQHVDGGNRLVIASGGTLELASGAALSLPAGTAAAGSAPLKLPAGTVMTTPEPGAFETDGTALYWTNGAGVRKTITIT